LQIKTNRFPNHTGGSCRGECVTTLVRPEDLEKKRIFLILTSSAKSREHNIEIIRDVADLGYHVLVITTNYPWSVLTKLYGEKGVDPSRICFIDAVTHNSIGNVEDIPGVVRYVHSPADLTAMGIAVTEVIREHSGEKICIVYDSISTMLIYLSSQNLTKFIHFVTNKLRLLDISGVFLAVEKGLDPQILSQLTTFVDTVIDTD
jgi:hypothetical protein